MQKLDRSVTTSRFELFQVFDCFFFFPFNFIDLSTVLSYIFFHHSSLTVNALAGLTGAGGLSVPAINVPSVDIVGVPSECLLLNNMFDPQIEVGNMRNFVWKTLLFLCFYLRVILH